jgi:phospholipid/cholesterol/gamma-HCH transport system ATP-binding protein
VNSVSGNVIEVRGLKAGYDKDLILDGVDFAVRRGEIVAVMGASGCGKSTLLKVLIGALPPQAGQVQVLGEDLSHRGEEVIQRLCHRFGMLYQFGALFGDLTIGENVALPLQEFSKLPPGVIDEIVSLKLEAVGMGGCQDLYPAELSGGMRKRAGLARAMSLDPELLYFDEPSSGLDPVMAAGLDQLILKLREMLGTTMVVVTHDLDSAFAIADRMVLLDRTVRGILAEGPPAAFRGAALQRQPADVVRFFARDGLDRFDDRPGKADSMMEKQA